MKKIFILIIAGILFTVLNVNAEVFYTPYRLYETGLNEYIAETDTLMRIERIFYNNYFLERVNKGYYDDGENPDFAPFKDEEDYLTSQHYSNKYVIGAEGPFSMFLVEENDQARYIKIHNFVGSKKQITKFSIYYENQPVNFEIIETNVISDQNLNMASYYWLDLKEELTLAELRIEIDVTSSNANQLSMMMEFYQERTAPLIKRYVNIINISGEITNNIINFIFGDVFLALGLEIPFVDNDRIELMEYLNYFSYFKNQYQYYDLEKIVTDNYTEMSLLNHFHDVDDFYILYDYYEREQIEINTKIQSIEDEIINSSSLEKHNIRIEGYNPLINGEQLVTIFMDDDIIFTCLINVDIPLILEEHKDETPNKIDEITSVICSEEDEIITQPVLGIQKDKPTTTKKINQKKETISVAKSKDKPNSSFNFTMFAGAFTLLFLSIFLKKKS